MFELILILALAQATDTPSVQRLDVQAEGTSPARPDGQVPSLRTRCNICTPDECPASLRNEAEIFDTLRVKGWLKRTEEAVAFTYQATPKGESTQMHLFQGTGLAAIFRAPDGQNWQIYTAPGLSLIHI